MGLEIAKLRKRCPLCKERRAQRYCLRNGKDICWACCNSKRIDKKCPYECSYTIQKNKEGEQQPLKTKIDSYTEHISLVTLEIDKWTELPEKQFNGKIPSKMAAAEEGRLELENYIDSLNRLPAKVVDHLRERLKLPGQKKEYTHYEDISTAYLDKVVELDWEGSIQLMSSKSRYDNPIYKENYIRRRAGNRLLKRVTSYHIILSAISDKADEALVYYELNGKYDLTIHCVNEAENGEQWKVASLIIGHPQLFYGISEIEGQIYNHLYHNKLEEAATKLKSFSEMFIDSKEIFYLYGLYYTMQDDYQKGYEMFLTCAELDPKSYDYRYNYAFTAMMTGKQEKAKEIYKELLHEKPDDIKTINNLAVIYLKENNLLGAKKMWERCLEVDCDFKPAIDNLNKFCNE